MSEHKQVSEINNDTMQLTVSGIIAISILLSFTSCSVEQARIKSEEQIKMTELKLQYTQPISEESKLGIVYPK